MSRYFGLHDSGILLSQSKTHAYKFHLNVCDNTVIIYNYRDNILIIHNWSSIYFTTKIKTSLYIVSQAIYCDFTYINKNKLHYKVLYLIICPWLVIFLAAKTAVDFTLLVR